MHRWTGMLHLHHSLNHRCCLYGIWSKHRCLPKGLEAEKSIEAYERRYPFLVTGISPSLSLVCQLLPRAKVDGNKWTDIVSHTSRISSVDSRLHFRWCSTCFCMSMLNLLSHHMLFLLFHDCEMPTSIRTIWYASRSD